MVQSSFYSDTPNYATDYPTQNDSNTNPTTGNTPAPSSFYPSGPQYVDVTTSNATLAEVEAAVAETQANADAAAASAAAAASSASGASTSASSASGSATAAATSASNAALSETNAANSASAASGSAAAAAGSATAASGSATAAAGSATSASTSAVNAATDATNAANSASSAATSASNAAAAVQAAAGTATPIVDGTATVGSGVKWAREDHIHPTDTSRAPLASPALTGTPTAPTATLGTNTTQLATTAFVIANAGGSTPATALPIVDGTATVGVATKYAREDHIHPTDTSRAPLASPAFTGTPSLPTGTTGVTQSAGDSSTKLATTAFVASEAVRYDAAQSLTATQKAQGRANIDALKKNYIVNGAMMVSQENGTTAGTAANYYPVDTFFGSHAHGGTTTYQQVASVTPAGSPNRLRVTATVADASVAAGDLLQIITYLEGLRVADLRSGSASAKTVTLQFGCKGPAGTYGVVIVNSAGNRFYPSSFTISGGEANTDVVKSVTLTLDTTGTWLSDTGAGLDIRWWLMGGTTYQTATQNSWTGTANSYCPTTQFNFMGTAGNVFELFDVGLYEGSVAPAFQVPDYASELLACMRYFQVGYTRLDGYAGGVATISQGGTFGVYMRATPTMTLTGAATAVGVVNSANYTITGGATYIWTFSLGATSGAGGYIGAQAWKAVARI